MLAPARFPLGVPGAYALPDARGRALHPQRMDACGFVGVAPRGPARQPVVDAGHAAGWRMLTDGRPLRRSVAVPVRNFDEYLLRFGGFEGPGLLPQAVASYFEQGGRLAWIVRVVHARNEPFAHRRAHGTLAGAFAAPLSFLARDEGSWGNRLAVTASFRTTALGFAVGTGGALETDPRSPLQAGDLLRLTDAQGQMRLARITGLARLRDPLRARERTVLALDSAPAAAPVRVELVEAVLDVDDGAGRRERFDHLALAADHPMGIANVLCERSTLVWPHPDWAGLDLLPRRPQLELLQSRSEPFEDGDDAWDSLVPEDFFDAGWSPAEDEAGAGIAALARTEQVTQVCVPDLYLPAQWAGPEFIEAVPRGTAGAEFAECVTIPAAATVPSTPPVALTGLVIDPRTLAGLQQVAALQQRVVELCEGNEQIALLDVPPGLSQGRIEHWRALFDSAWAAGYQPWLIPARRNGEDGDSGQARERRMPPSAVAAGIIARRELERGLQWGPANEIARQVVHFADPQPPGLADALHPINVNCFVREPDGIALAAARTLSRDTRWRQLSVRRLVLMLKRALRAQMQWAVFEPNGPALWRDMRHAIESLLRGLFRAGAFRGATEAESFFVRVLAERALLDRGELVVEIGVAPAEPLEFILVRLRRDADGTLNLEE